MTCSIVVNLPGKSPIVASERDEDPCVAIARAVVIAGRTVNKTASRRFPARVRLSGALAAGTSAE